VDPLACMHLHRVLHIVASKGFWANILGWGDFYYQLSVQVVEACLVSRATDGGLTDIKHVRDRIIKRRGKSRVDVSTQDIERAVTCLEPLQSGFTVVEWNQIKFVQSLPRELSHDETSVLGLVPTGSQAYTTIQDIQTRLGWTVERAQACLVSS
jgi:ESCRT-II complex subunit VPS22